MEHVEMIVEYLTDGSDFQYYDNHGTIIRCKDCALYGINECNMRHGFMGIKDDDYCSYGEKKMDDYEEFEELDFVQPHKKIPVNLVVDNWIPCSRKVPEEKGMYLTTTIDKGVYCDYWNGVNFDRTELVIAWRSLPEPYKER
jgi:hypothetical protein